jgi:hypothetical protein
MDTDELVERIRHAKVTAVLAVADNGMLRLNAQDEDEAAMALMNVVVYKAIADTLGAILDDD